MIKKILLSTTIILSTLIISSCGNRAFLDDAVNASKTFIESGDIIIASGGAVASNATPFPLHEAHIYSMTGAYKGRLHKESVGFLMGLSLNYSHTGLLLTIDNVDRIGEINFTEQNAPTNHILDANLTGATMRAVASLSDGGTVVAESTTVFEKYDSNGTRVVTNFPITVTANTMKVRSISGGRFALVYTGGNDSVSIRNNNGTVAATIASGIACGTNCDPTDIIELNDGRFVIAYNNATAMGLYLYSSSFALVGTLYQNTSIVQGTGSMAVMANGDILTCSTTLNVCERFTVSGNTATRVGTSAFLSDVGKIRQPTDVVVVP